MRCLRPEDSAWVWDLDQDPEVMRFINGGVPTPRDFFEREILPRLLRSYDRGPQFGFWAATLSDTDDPVGWFHLRPEKLEPFEMEVGYRLRRDMWGRGLATEGTMELLRRAFSDWDVPRVVALTLQGNQASRRVMEKCGMKWERDFVCPESWWPGSSENDRRAVRYLIDRC